MRAARLIKYGERRALLFGVMPDGRMTKLVALEDDLGRWRVLHATVPPTKKFQKELEMTRRCAERRNSKLQMALL